jgi:hypothetical protein
LKFTDVSEEITAYTFMVEELDMQIRVMLRLAISQPFLLGFEFRSVQGEILVFV